MVTEIATIYVVPGQEEAFIEAYQGARHLLAASEGCRSIRMTRGVESPSIFTLIVEWDSVQAHLDNFRATERFDGWRAAIGPHFEKAPHVEHFVDVD